MTEVCFVLPEAAERDVDLLLGAYSAQRAETLARSADLLTAGASAPPCT